jgi:hypothetical protein
MPLPQNPRKYESDDSSRWPEFPRLQSSAYVLHTFKDIAIIVLFTQQEVTAVVVVVLFVVDPDVPALGTLFLFFYFIQVLRKECFGKHGVLHEIVPYRRGGDGCSCIANSSESSGKASVLNLFAAIASEVPQSAFL